MHRVFFLFGRDEPTRLAHLIVSLPPRDRPNLVITCLPGISTAPLDALAESFEFDVWSFESALERFSITQKHISEVETELVLAVFNEEVFESVLRTCLPQQATGIRSALLNHSALLLHHSIAFELLFHSLCSGGLAEVHCFRPSGKFAILERLDVNRFLRPELMVGPHLESLSCEAGVPLFKHGWIMPGFASAIDALRNLFLRGYKFLRLLQRSRSTERACAAPELLNGCALFVIRADTELSSARPLIDALGKLRYPRPLLFVDDLLKAPTASDAVGATGFDWVKAHAFTRWFQVFATLVDVWARTSKIVRLIADQFDVQFGSKPAKAGFLCSSTAVRALLKTSFATVPELVVFARQLESCIRLYKPSVIISFDTVDRWGAIQGAIARRHGIASLMVQNTAIDDIRYPLPVSTDHLIVANDYLRTVMLASGAKPDRVHAKGLPQHDRAIRAGEERLSKLREATNFSRAKVLRILVATQPFVQAFDYNAQLLGDLRVALSEIGGAWEIFVKLHPREVPKSHQSSIESFRSSGVRVHTLDGVFDSALDDVDLVISRTSTSLQLAVVGGVPAIAYLRDYPYEIIERLDYLRDPVVEKVFDRRGLRASLSSFLQPDERSAIYTRFAERRLSYLDRYIAGRGTATDGVIEMITHLSRTGSAQ